MSNVYFLPTDSSSAAVSAGARRLLEALIAAEALELEPKIPVKTHFGEKGNRTFIRPENYAGIIDFLKSGDRACCYMETSVLYGGQRFERESHLKLACEHGFTQLPVVIADGASGEDLTTVEIHKKHFQRCSLGSAFAAYPQILVISHFKGHMLAGFGGAIKQLGMGFAAKGGKLAMHMGVRPRIRKWRCKRCGLCKKRCQANAIELGASPHIDAARCLGCGACFAICPNHAVSILSWGGLWNALFKGRFFREKLVEYAYAAHHGHHHIYLNFALNITRGCDCEPLPMRSCIPDIGVFASTDPVAVDQACLDAAAKGGKRFKGAEQLAYAEKIGLGTRQYRLVEIK